MPFHLWFVSISVFPLFRLEEKTSHGHIHSWSVLLPFFIIIINYFHAAMNYLSYLFSFILNIIKKNINLPSSLKSIPSGATDSQKMTTPLPAVLYSTMLWPSPLPTAWCYDHGHHKKNLEQRCALGFHTEPVAHSDMPAFTLPHLVREMDGPLSRWS